MGRDPSWIIIASAYAPDFDIIAGEFLKKLDLDILTTPIRHGDFHNIAFLLLFATAAALVLRLAGMRFGDSFLFAGIWGGGAVAKNEGFSASWISLSVAEEEAEVGDRVI